MAEKTDDIAKAAKDETLDVTSGVIWKQLIQLYFPIFLSAFMQQLYAFMNTWIVGQFAGKEAVGGIQVTMPLTDLAVGFAIGVGAGCAVIVGQHFGAHDYKRLAQSIHTAMGISIVGGFLFAVGGVLLVPWLLSLMSTPAYLMPTATIYAQIYFAALVFSLIYNMGSSLMRALGDSRTPSVIIAAALVFNLILDFIFVALLGWQAVGCGIATLLSYCFAAGLVVWKLSRASGPWRLVISQIRINKKIARIMLLTGLPLGVQSAAYSISNIIAQADINAFGVDAATGWGLGARIDGIIWQSADALGVAVTAFSAQNFGARRYDRMRQGVKVSTALSLVLVGVFSILVFVYAEKAGYFFLNDAAVVGFSTFSVRFIAPFYVIYALTVNISGIIRGSGESVRPMVITLFGTCLLRIVWLLFVVPIYHSIETVLLSYPITWFITAVIYIVYYRTGRWLVAAKKKEQKRAV